MSKEIGFEEIKDAKNIKENVMNAFPDYIEVDKVGKYDKFVTFPFKRGMYSFGSSSLECDEIPYTEKNESLGNMIRALQKVIDAEVEKELVPIRNELILKYEQKYKIRDLMNCKIKLMGYRIMPKTSGAFQDS